MKKKEFIDELRYNLEGELSKQDIDEITSDYSDVFTNDGESGTAEEDTAERLGSPARIARTILEEDELKKREAAMMGIDPRYALFIKKQASMGRRLVADILDSLLQVMLVYVVLFGSVAILEAIGGAMGNVRFEYLQKFIQRAAVTMVLSSLLMACFNILPSIFIWTTNGYTPGKWLMKIRVVKLNGQKISFKDALVREILVKSIANIVTSGLLNMFSFIWGCVSNVKKTVHDVAAETTVVKEKRR